MYQKISITAFILTFCLIGLSNIIWPSTGRLRNPLKTMVHLFTLPFFEQKLSLAGAFRKLVYLVTLFCFLVLAITGFYPTLVLGEHISGYLIMLHATFAPIFAICIAILAVMWAGNCRFNNKDWPWFQRIIEHITLTKSTEQPQSKETCLGQKISFWLIIFLTLPLALSIVLSMLPYFGTGWQDLFLFIHRYIALIFALVVIVHTHLIVRAQIKQ
jgi:cytochrome b subunit of formate dehydrogenase